jgi:hypothetical protein
MSLFGPWRSTGPFGWLVLYAVFFGDMTLYRISGGLGMSHGEVCDSTQNMRRRGLIPWRRGVLEWREEDEARCGTRLR